MALCPVPCGADTDQSDAWLMLDAGERVRDALRDVGTADKTVTSN